MTEEFRLALSLSALIIAFCIGVGIIAIAADPSKEKRP